MNKFDALYNSIISEAPLKDYIAAIRRREGSDKPGYLDRTVGKYIGGAGRMAGKAVSGLGSIAGKTVGAVGQALGTKGKPIPGTGLAQAGIQKATGLAGKAIGGLGTAVQKGFQYAADIEDEAKGYTKPAATTATAPAAAPSFTTVPAAILPKKPYRTNDKIIAKDPSGKTFTGLYSGTFKGRDGQMYINVLNPSYK